MVSSLFPDSSFLQSTLDDIAPADPTLALESGELRWLSRGMAEFVPANQGPDTPYMVLSSGIHGDETIGMEIVSALISEIEKGVLACRTRCLFIIAHPQATHDHTRFIDENLNRLFAGAGEHTSCETEIAKRLMSEVDRFYSGSEMSQRWHLDLHNAIRDSKHYTFAVSPASPHPVRSRALCDFLASARIEAVLLSEAPSSTFSWYSADKHGAQALTMELGKVCPFGKNKYRKVAAFSKNLRHLLAGEEYKGRQRAPKIYRVTRTIIKTHREFSFTFADTLANFTRFKKGELLAIDGEEFIYAECDREAVVFPNSRVAINHRAALMVTETPMRFESDQLIAE